MPPPRYQTVFDPERAVEQLDREQQELVRMTGADSRRIDNLVGDVGQIKGQVAAVSGKVDGVADGVEKLNSAMAGLVKFSLQVEHQHQQQELQRATVATQETRIQALEKQIGPLVELRTWVIFLCLGAAALMVSKLMDLLAK